ncbi:MAG TPA: Ig-like domain-containing protein [Streptosporangiales bacterium]
MRTTRPVAALACLVLTASCTPATGQGDGGHGGASRSGTPAPKRTGPISVHITPADHAEAVAPNKPITVRVNGGAIESLTVESGKGGGKVTGKTAADGSSWQSSGTLHPSASYTVTVHAKNDARTARAKASFTTLTPRRSVKAAIAPLDGSVVGVGQPIGVYLTEPAKDRAAVERALTVRTDRDVTGVWHWFSSTELHFRPQTYWPAHTKVTLHADLAGVKAAPGVWGVQDRTIRFTVGARHSSVVDARTHRMTVRSGDEVVKRYPVSTGRPQYPTKSGVHVVMGKADPYTMRSSTWGVTGAGAYVTTVRYAVRISNSGEFVHAAPWSAGQQGRNNVSHGCVNLSTSRAKWFYDFSQPGDIVTVVGTKATLQPTNGFGDWNVSWPDWVAGSALH